MSHPEIVLVTTTDLPTLHPDTKLLVSELAALGVHSEVVPWDAPYDWSEVPLVVLHTPWDYVHHLDRFLAWVAYLESVTRLLNPPALVRWNAHKRYLLDLAGKHVPILPTRLLRAVEAPPSALCDGLFEAQELVVKPAVSVSAIGAMRGSASDPALLQHAGELLAAGDVLVQPFAPDVAVNGEVSLVYFEGVFSHAVRKRPAAGDYRVQDDYGGTVHPYEPTAREREVALAALAATPLPTTYSRIDLIQFEDGPVVMELEAIEPELFLRYAPGSAARFAQSLKHTLRK